VAGRIRARRNTETAPQAQNPWRDGYDQWLVGGTKSERLLELSLPTEPVSCARACHEIRAALRGAAVDVAAVELAVSEAVSNAVLHAYRERDSATAEPRLRLRLTEDDEGIWVVVSDDGVGMSPRDAVPGLGSDSTLWRNSAISC
jgi:anti-sigma regulatory factor (Ser/Thr protein kinase)